MSVVFSKSCEYALQAVLFLAHDGGERPVQLKEISKQFTIPLHFLSKVLQNLTRHDIVVSYKGSNGGFLLNRSASDITLLDVIHAMDGKTFLDQCILGFPGCGDKHPCPVHASWKSSKEILLNTLEKKTIAQLSKSLDGKIKHIRQLNG